MSGPFNFQTTRWSVVVSAGQSETQSATDAMEQLCRRYWFPLFAFIRRRGHKPSDAEDLVQAFFARVIEKDVIAAADRDRGRFRTFLLSALEHFLSNESAKANAARRGGGRKLASLDSLRSDSPRSGSPRSGSPWPAIGEQTTPQDEFHRQWAIAVLTQVLDAIGEEYEREGKAELFEALRPYLSTDSTRQPYAAVAKQLNMTESNIKVAVHRLRRRYRKQLELEIAATVQSPDEVEDEIRQLFIVLAR